MFITVEGIDGAGKTMVVETIDNKYDIIKTSEPTEFWTGKQVRRALKSDTPEFTDLFLLLADRCNHIENLIKPELDKGNIVVSDRFSDSSLAYQTVTLQKFHRNPFMYIDLLMVPWTIEPNLTIYLDISVETALERSDKEEKYETYEMLEQVKNNYDDIKNRFSHRYVTVNGEQSKEEVKSEVLDIVSNKLERGKI